ncbi:MAG: hypothetical protein H6887_15030 [Hoeflea sp.]|nr:hypothetical protein [Hoeflea sp.]
MIRAALITILFCVPSLACADAYKNMSAHYDIEKLSIECTSDGSKKIDWTRYCTGVFYCGDGGCDSGSVLLESTKNALSIAKIKAILATHRTLDVYDLEEYRGLKLIEGRDKILQVKSDACASFVIGASHRRSGWMHLSGDADLDQFCISVYPGNEPGVVLALREIDGVKEVSRTGGGAGNPSLSMVIPRSTFFDAVNSEMTILRPIVKNAFEKVLSISCDSAELAKCAIVAKNGALDVDLIFPYSRGYGKVGHWHHAYFQIKPNVWSDRYLTLEFQMPITRIRRWPAEVMPDVFESVDFDDDFETIRYAVMDAVADMIDGCIADQYPGDGCSDSQ